MNSGTIDLSVVEGLALAPLAERLFTIEMAFVSRLHSIWCSKLNNTMFFFHSNIVKLEYIHACILLGASLETLAS